MPPRSVAQFEDGPEEPIILSWDAFKDEFLALHKQGEHVAIVGPNGSGKTVMGLELCKLIGSRPAKDKRPSRVTVLQYKPRDDTVKMVIPDWPVIKSWPPHYGQEHVIVWPKSSKPSQSSRLERAVFAPLLDEIYTEGGQTIYVPEAAYFERAQPHGLGLGAMMEKIWSTARSLKVTMVSDTQRPRHVTLLMWTEPVWVVIYRVEYDEDLKLLAKHSGCPLEVWDIVPQLGKHECMVIYRPRQGTGERAIYVTKVAHVTGSNKKERGK